MDSVESLSNKMTENKFDSQKKIVIGDIHPNQAEGDDIQALQVSFQIERMMVMNGPREEVKRQSNTPKPKLNVIAERSSKPVYLDTPTPKSQVPFCDNFEEAFLPVKRHKTGGNFLIVNNTKNE